ncbi:MULTISPECIES: LysR family transcriptional regulator [unclassified Agarivorans]|nr:MULTISPECIES: LysR family transcriptional regulator [unclassified Agarivorans]MDO6687349.1 LysR family transcriptional regulator [Agarivorans sp. 3_MG-2023]MDO6717007.1 LysR family transcriptional regulator [Agarivorans sp. 2_MG-2023]
MKDLNALHVFLALMHTRSTTKAARKLGRSQSYVSKVLAQLREQLDDPLFVRHAGELQPTGYAESIAPKLKRALVDVDLALEPDEFEPSSVSKVTLHIVEPYLITLGKQIIDAIREQTSAVIEMRQWGANSESLILREEVDLGLHVINDKPQSFYQKRIHSGAGYFHGNQSGEYVKFLISGVNEHQDHFKALDPTIEVGIIVDSHILLDQLMGNCFTLKYEPYYEKSQQHQLNIDVALIMKSSLRYSAKQQWLSNLISSIIDRHNSEWLALQGE